MTNALDGMIFRGFKAWRLRFTLLRSGVATTFWFIVDGFWGWGYNVFLGGVKWILLGL